MCLRHKRNKLKLQWTALHLLPPAVDDRIKRHVHEKSKLNILKQTPHISIHVTEKVVVLVFKSSNIKILQVRINQKKRLQVTVRTPQLYLFVSFQNRLSFKSLYKIVLLLTVKVWCQVVTGGIRLSFSCIYYTWHLLGVFLKFFESLNCFSIFR